MITLINIEELYSFSFYFLHGVKDRELKLEQHIPIFILEVKLDK